MYWQSREILRRKNLTSDAATEVVDLPRSNILSGLLVRYECTNGATGGGGEFIDQAIDKIEVIADGSKELFSLTGREALKYAQNLLGRMPDCELNDCASAVQWIEIPVCFGRQLGDMEYFLDCAKYTSLELRFTYSPTIAADKFATGTSYLSVLGLMAMEGAPSPQKGLIKTSRKKNFTSEASGDKEIDLPLGNLYYRLLVYAYEAGTRPEVNISRVKLELNDGEKVLADHRWEELELLNYLDFKPLTAQSYKVLRTANDSVDTYAGNIIAAAVATMFDHAAATDFPVYNIVSVSGGRVTLDGILVEGSATWAAVAVDTVKRNHFLTVWGRSYGNLVVIPFDVNRDMANLLNSAAWDKVKLVLTQGDAGADVSVILQEVLPS